MPPAPDRSALEAAARALAEHGTITAAARALGIPRTTLAHRLREQAPRAALPVPEPKPPKEKPPTRASHAANLGRIAELLERSGIPVEEIGRVERIRLNEWQGLSKDADGNPIVTDMTGSSVILTPRWADGPEWPVVTQAPAVTVERTARTPHARSGIRRCVVLPDMQINYFSGPAGELVPTHDEQCLSIALQIIEDADPDVVVMNGDNLDLSEMSKYRKMPIFQRMTQPTIDRAGRLMASIRARVRCESEIIWLEGNHELRLPVYAIDNAVAAYGLKRANAPGDWPVLSVPHLCRLDDYSVTYVSGYPANGWMLNDNLEIIHGHKVKTGGSTAHAYLPELRHSVCYGHVHREEMGTVTRKTAHGPRTYESFSFGCLCRTDGRVPGTEGGFSVRDGQPVLAQNNWTNGLGVIEYEPGDGDFWREPIRIWHGETRWRGKTYSAGDDHKEAT